MSRDERPLLGAPPVVSAVAVKRRRLARTAPVAGFAPGRRLASSGPTSLEKRRKAYGYERPSRKKALPTHVDLLSAYPVQFDVIRAKLADGNLVTDKKAMVHVAAAAS